VKALQKPPASAWAVNQVYWRHRKQFDQLLAAGERFRKAQASQLAGKAADLRAPLDARRQALSDLSKIAAEVLREHGYTATPDTMRRVNTTLEALATYGSHPDAPAAGRLTYDVDPPGFEALTALVPRGSRSGLKGTEPTRVIPFARKPPEARAGKKKLDPKEEARQKAEERKAQQAAARAAVQEAERTLRDARKAAAEAEGALKKVAAKAKETERVKADIEKKFEKASADADAARHEARHVAAEAEDAAQAVDEAERALDKLKSELAKLT
jgi:DNA repair exonuclease SbcCD ATPase subunit